MKDIEQKRPEDRTLAEIVETMILISLNRNDRLNALDGKGSPYASEEELRKNIIEDYKSLIKPLKIELDKREKFYSK